VNGKITFADLDELAEFLKKFTGSTATFTVRQREGDWILEFTGGF
jgi:hypothetical protein